MAGVRQYGTEYWSSFQHLDPVNVILSDRYFEAETWPHELDKPTGVFELVMPLLLSCVLTLPPPDPDTTLPNPSEIPYLDFSDTGFESPRLTKKNFTGSFSSLTADNAHALVQYCCATSVDDALRQMSGMDALTRVSDEMQPILLAHLPAICIASDQCHSANGNKAQYRLGWDKISSVVENAVAKDGSRIRQLILPSKHLERVIPSARNVRFDADIAREQLPWGRQNESLDKASDLVRSLPQIVLPKAMLSNDMSNDIRAHLKKVLPGRDVQWKTNVAGRQASLDLPRIKRKLLDDILQTSKGTQSGVHVLGVDFAFARCDTSAVISVTGVFPEGSFVDDVIVKNSLDILRGAQEEVDQPIATISVTEENGSGEIPSFLSRGPNHFVGGVSYLAAIGIIDFLIFGVSTIGSRGRLLCAGGTRKQGSERISIHVADANCPEWDISDRVQAIRFVAVREDFLEAWEDRDSEGSPLKWTVEAQKKEAAYLSLKKRRDELEQSDIYKEITELRTKLKSSSSM